MFYCCLFLFFLARYWVYAILHALKWCVSHASSCNFQSDTLFSDSQSVLSTLYTPLQYLIPKFLTDTRSLLNCLSDSKVVHRQWIPGHSSLPGNNLANTLAKLVPLMTPPSYHSLFFFPTAIPLHQLATWYLIWFLPKPNTAVSSEELTLLCSACCALFCCCNRHSTHLAPYPTGLIEQRLLHCSKCGFKSQKSFISF